MKNYELIVIYNPQLSDNQIKEALEKTKKIISSHQGEILTEDALGRKKFTHAIKKNRDGFYYYMKIKGLPAEVKEMSYTLRLQENVLRVSLISASLETVKK